MNEKKLTYAYDFGDSWELTIELTGGRKIEGEVWSSHSEDGNICLDVEIGENQSIEIFRKDVKAIKAFPIN